LKFPFIYRYTIFIAAQAALPLASFALATGATHRGWNWRRHLTQPVPIHLSHRRPAAYALFSPPLRSQCRKAAEPPRWAIASFNRKRICSASFFALAAESFSLCPALLFSNVLSPALRLSSQRFLNATPDPGKGGIGENHGTQPTSILIRSVSSPTAFEISPSPP